MNVCMKYHTVVAEFRTPSAGLLLSRLGDMPTGNVRIELRSTTTRRSLYKCT